MDLTGFYASYRDDGLGGATYDPEMMLVGPSTPTALGSVPPVGLNAGWWRMSPTGCWPPNQGPDHATVARFRRRHQEAIAALFVQVLGLCVEAGLVHTDLVAIDGTKLAADASFFANRTKEELVAGILQEAERTDVEEDERFGDSRGDGARLPPRGGGPGSVPLWMSWSVRDRGTMRPEWRNGRLRRRLWDGGSQVPADSNPAFRRAPPGEHH